MPRRFLAGVRCVAGSTRGAGKCVGMHGWTGTAYRAGGFELRDAFGEKGRGHQQYLVGVDDGLVLVFADGDFDHFRGEEAGQSERDDDGDGGRGSNGVSYSLKLSSRAFVAGGGSSASASCTLSSAASSCVAVGFTGSGVGWGSSVPPISTSRELAVIAS